MSEKKIVNNALDYVVFENVYLKKLSPGSQRKAQTILEAWIDLVSRKKSLHVSLNDLAKELETPSSSLKYYFSGIEELRETAFQYVRVIYQSYVVNSVSEVGLADPYKTICSYFDSSVEWPKINPKYTFLWLQFLSLSSKYKTRREFNSKAVEAGFQRLVSLIEYGQNAGVFQEGSAHHKARLIQILITGLILSEATEESAVIENQAEVVKKQCIELL